MASEITNDITPAGENGTAPKGVTRIRDADGQEGLRFQRDYGLARNARLMRGCTDQFNVTTYSDTLPPQRLRRP